MKLINSKEALLFELGDFGIAEDTKENTNKQPDEVAESGMFEVDENGSIVGFEEVQEEEVVDEDNPDATEASGEETVSGGSPMPQTPEEQGACIEAAVEAMKDKKMPKKLFDWGLDYITKMGKAQADTLWAEWEAIDKEELKRQFEQMDAEDEAEEQAEKERFLNS